MVDRGKNTPFRLSAINRFVFEYFVRSPLPSDFAKLHSADDGRARQFVDRVAAFKQPQVWFVDEGNVSRISAFQLDQSCHEIGVFVSKLLNVTKSLNDFELCKRC